MKTLIASLAAALVALPALAGEPPRPEPRERAEYADLRCQTETLNVYFPAGESALTPAASDAIGAFVARFEGCDIADLHARVGAGDADSLAASTALAGARRTAIFDALESAGVPLRASAHDKAGEIFLAASAEGRALPLSRRTRVTFSLRPAVIG
jgi:type IV pilus biogenesis protein CpaD/CtpE